MYFPRHDVTDPLFLAPSDCIAEIGPFVSFSFGRITSLTLWILFHNPIDAFLVYGEQQQFSFTPRECLVCKGHNQWNREKTSSNGRKNSIGFSLILYGLSFHTYKVYLIDFMNLNLEKMHIKKYKTFSRFTLLHRASSCFLWRRMFKVFISLFSFPLCSFFPKSTKNAFRKVISKNVKIFCENLFSILDYILDFWKNNFSKVR